MSCQGSGHTGGQQHHQSQQPHQPPGSSTQAGPSNQAGTPTHATISVALDPGLNDLHGINHAFFHDANGFKNQALARAHPRCRDILVVNLFVLRNLLGLKLIDFPELMHSPDEFRNVQLRAMDSFSKRMDYRFHTTSDAIVLALAASKDTTFGGRCFCCHQRRMGPMRPFFNECRIHPNFFGQACGNCELHRRRGDCGFCELCFRTPSHADY